MSGTTFSPSETATQVHSTGKRDWRLLAPSIATMSSYQEHLSPRPQIQEVHSVSDSNQQRLVHQQPIISSYSKGWHLAWVIFHVLSIIFCAVAIGTSVSLSNNRDASYGWLITICVAPPVWRLLLIHPAITPLIR